MLKTLAAAAFTLSLSGCASMWSGDSGPHEGAQRFLEAFNRQDAVALAALYAEDARILPPDRPMIAGRANILVFWQGAFNSGFSYMEKRPLFVMSGGDLAAETGNFVVTYRGQKLAGKDSLVWRRGADRRWFIVSDIWNMDR